MLTTLRDQRLKEKKELRHLAPDFGDTLPTS